MRDDDNYRWGDDPADGRELDAWITREDGAGNDEDCMAGVEPGPDTMPCGECAACLAHALAVADEATP